MAKRRSAGKIQPAPLEMWFELPIGTSYIDLSQCASILNRRFYRQGLNWAVSGFKLIAGPGQTGNLTISKIPQTWMVSNAWEKCFRAWKRQQDEVIEDGMQQSVKAAFNDFKIYMDTDHHSSAFSSNLLPSPLFVGAPVPLPGEWEASQIVIPNYGAPGVNYEPYLNMVGDDVGGVGGSIGMVKAYANSRGTPQEPMPAVPAGVISPDNFLSQMFDVGDNNEDVLDNVVLKNDHLPYVQDDYPGADVQYPTTQVFDTMSISAAATTNYTSVGGTNFPCGLIRLDSTADLGAFTFRISLVPGSSRGYLTQPMTEM